MTARAIPLLPEQADCLRRVEPVCRAVVDELLDDPPADLARELAIAGCIAVRRWDFDPGDRDAIETARTDLARLRAASARLPPAVRGALDARGGSPEPLGPLAAALDGLLLDWPRRPRQRPANPETVDVLRLWEVLRRHRIPMRAGARVIAEIFLRLGAIAPKDRPGYPETLYQRIRNAAISGK